MNRRQNTQDRKQISEHLSDPVCGVVLTLRVIKHVIDSWFLPEVREDLLKTRFRLSRARYKVQRVRWIAPPHVLCLDAAVAKTILGNWVLI